MKRNPIRIAMVVGALVASIGLTTAAAARPGPGGCERLERKLERLDLSAESEAAAFAIVDAAQPEERALRAEKRQARDALRGLLEADPVDEAAVMAQADAIAGLEGREHQLGLRTMLAVRGVLSEEERTAFLEMRDRRHRR